MKFQRYGSIENITRQKALDYIVGQGLSGGEWVVQEKVHGANFSIWFQDPEIKFAKRSQFIDDEDNFYQYCSLKAELIDNIMSIVKDLDAKEVVIYGELCGGSYPHPDVKRNNLASTVQQGVYYSPNNEFYAFDLVVNGNYQCVDHCDVQFTNNMMVHATTLFRGTLTECLEFDNEYVSTVPAQFGLPTIEGNICEGNVIKPVQPKFLANGSRVVLKNKNSKFTEKEHKPKTLRDTPEQLMAKYPDAFEALEYFNQYITENRLRNVISKEGEITQKGFGKLVGLFVQDIREEGFKDLSDMPVSPIPALDTVSEKIFNKQLGGYCSTMIRENFVNILDGNF